MTLEDEIRHFLVDQLALEDINAEDIDPEEPLFGAGLGLDSIDALELGLAISKAYHIKIDPKQDDVSKHFASVNALATFIRERREQPSVTSP